jgi:threonine/homoserine/homoserine lactone efflux protein
LNGDPVFIAVYLILTGLTVGVILAAPVGPVNIVCIQRTLERGFWAGFAAGLGAVFADGIIAAIAAFGINAIDATIDAHKVLITYIGAAVMIGFGLRLIFVEPKVMAAATTSMARLRRIVELVPERLRPMLRLSIWRVVPHASVIPQTFFLTITNPGAILGTLLFFGSIVSKISAVHQTAWHALTLVASVMMGGTLWWAGLASVVARIRHRLTRQRLRLINQVAGIILLVSGAALLLPFTSNLLDHSRTGGAGVTSQGLQNAGTPFLLPGLKGQEK